MSTDPLSLSHVSQPAWCYPGEPITFQTRIVAARAVRDVKLRLAVDSIVSIYDFEASSGSASELTENNRVLRDASEQWVEWHADALDAGSYLFKVSARADHFEFIGNEDWRDGMSQARLEYAGNRQLAVTQIRIKRRAAYLKYLPGLYRDDEVMGKLLMLCESMWRPIDQQIETIYNYFDPRIMPAGLLPWMGGWIDVVFDNHWPEEKRRKLLTRAVWLFRRRGTRRGLAEFLRLYTGLPVEIVEHRANNMRVGAGARLGKAVALGHKNIPFTFSVRIGRPPEQENTLEYRDRLVKIINQEKPAHTRYELIIE